MHRYTNTFPFFFSSCLSRSGILALSERKETSCHTPHCHSSKRTCHVHCIQDIKIFCLSDNDLMIGAHNIYLYLYIKISFPIFHHDLLAVTSQSSDYAWCVKRSYIKGGERQKGLGALRTRLRCCNGGLKWPSYAMPDTPASTPWTGHEGGRDRQANGRERGRWREIASNEMWGCIKGWFDFLHSARAPRIPSANTCANTYAHIKLHTHNYTKSMNDCLLPLCYM